MLVGKNRLSPSKAAFTSMGLSETNYEKSCYRYTAWERRYEKDSEIDPLYIAMGAIDEARFAAKLTRAGLPFTREQDLATPIAGSQVVIRGRYDFKVTGPDGVYFVEKKSTLSKNRLRDIIVKGVVDPHHLAQLITYMVIDKVPRGVVSVTYWQWDDQIDGLVVGNEREFQVFITPGGDIEVDGQIYLRHVRSLQAWFKTAAKGMEDADTVLPSRPKPGQAWSSPCRYCPLKDVCDQYDKTQNVAQFWQESKQIETRAGKPAEISLPPKVKGRKNERNQVSDSSSPSNDSGRIRDQASTDGGEVD